MHDYEVLFEQKAEMLDVEIIQQDIGSAVNWDDAYWIGRFVYEQASGEADKLIMDAYEKAFSLGLNIRVNREYFLTATQQIARIYFQFRKYDEAINKLMVLDSNVDDLPDWVNLYYASAQIHTENILYWAEVPEMLFRRIDGINEDDAESVKRRRFLFLEFLNRISELSKTKNLSEVDKESILNKALELGIADTRECLNFEAALGMMPSLPSAPEEADTDTTSVSEQMVAELKKQLAELQEIIDKQELIISLAKKESEDQTQQINELQNEINILKENASRQSEDAYVIGEQQADVEHPKIDILKVDSFLPRRQKILIIGGSETKENHLRGKLKSMGFDFSKDQLEFVLEYDNVKDYASRIKPWSGKYAGIIVGPCPHKAKEIEGYSSFIEQIKTEEGYPHIEEARDKAGTLKISNASIGDAMMRMAVYLQSIA